MEMKMDPWVYFYEGANVRLWTNVGKSLQIVFKNYILSTLI